MKPKATLKPTEHERVHAFLAVYRIGKQQCHFASPSIRTEFEEYKIIREKGGITKWRDIQFFFE